MGKLSGKWDDLRVLEDLSEAFGVAGFEEEVRWKIREHVEPFVDELQVDAMGSLHCILNPDGAFTLMLDAHMDEVGFVVRDIDEGGFLRLAPIGGWDVRILPGQTVLVRGSDGSCHTGVVGSIPPHVQEGEERNRVFQWKDLFVDLGAGSAKEVSEMKVRVGSPALLEQPFRRLGEGVVLGKALDDRAGCTVLASVLRDLADNRPEIRVVAVFSAAEEVGGRGAQVSARMREPQMALVVEGTMATDTPGVKPDQKVSSMGKGPVITAVDRSLIVPEPLVDRIIAMAETLGIPWQMKTPLVGGTDGGPIHTSGQGVLTGVISVPCRYIHSPACLMNVEDLRRTSQLVAALARQAPGIYGEIIGGQTRQPVSPG